MIDLDVFDVFMKADETMTNVVRNLCELITAQQKLCLDFNDVKYTLHKGGNAIIISGVGEGENRVAKAIENALESPLLKNHDVYGSKRILINFYFSPTSKTPFRTEEINEMRKFMTNFSNDVDVFWGVALDDTLGDKIKVTILAVGFNVSYPLNE